MKNIKKKDKYNEDFSDRVSKQEAENSVSSVLWADSLDLNDLNWLNIPNIEKIQAKVTENLDFTTNYNYEKLDKENREKVFPKHLIGHTRTWIKENGFNDYRVFPVGGVSSQEMLEAGKVNETLQWAIDDYKKSFVENKDIDEKLLDVFIFHTRFELVHPFRDGNGRTGRIIMNLMLKNLGYQGFGEDYIGLGSKGREEYISNMNKLKSSSTNGVSYNSFNKRNPRLVGNKFVKSKNRETVKKWFKSKIKLIKDK